MVLGATGFESAEYDNDEQKLVDKFYNLMLAAGVLPTDLTQEQAYPFIKGLITIDSARRQNLDMLENAEKCVKKLTMSAPQTSGTQAAMWTIDRDNVTPEEESQPTRNDTHGLKGLTPERNASFQQLLDSNPKMAQQWAVASASRSPEPQDMPVPATAEKNEAKSMQIGPAGMIGYESESRATPSPKASPPGYAAGLSDSIGIFNEVNKDHDLSTPPGLKESSSALARRLELSAVAVEKLQASAKSFGFIQAQDDISLPERDLVMIEQARKSFGMVKPRSECGEVTREAIPPGYATRLRQAAEAQATPAPIATSPDKAARVLDSHGELVPSERSCAEQFLKLTSHLSPEDRLKLVMETSGMSVQQEEGENAEETDRNRLNSAMDRIKEFYMNLEPQHYEFTDAFNEVKTLFRN